MSVYRSSTGELGHYDEPPRRAGGGERWDREKFERAGRRGRDEHERFHFEDHDHVGRHHHDIEFDRHVDRRGPRVIERERFHEDDHVHTPPRRHRTDFFDEPTASEVANRALAPYRRKSVVERDILDVAPTAPRRPARPQYLRRTSSLDTFDRRPMRRYGDHERIERVERKEDWRPPANVPIPLPIRERRRSPSRMRVREEDFEEIRYRDREPREEYREVEIRRDKSTTRRRSRSRRAVSVARTSRSSSLSSFEEISPPKHVGKKGKTRMPKRLVKKQAIIELGYPFEEDDDFIIVRRALEKEQIDEVIKISENYKDEKIMYVYEDRQESIAAPPPPPPPPADVHAYHVQPAPPPSVHYAQSIRSSSPSRHAHETFEERFEESSHIHGPLTVLVPDKRRDHHIIHDRDIKDEIQALETERRLLKYERERDSDYEIIERREPRREVIRVEKDRKGRRPANPKVIAAMMTTLT